MKPGALKKLGGKLLLVSGGILSAGWVASTAWISSGSSQWELELDKDGIQVYSLKAPGSNVKQFKGVVRGPYTQSQIVASLMLDNDSLENCKAWIPVCMDLTVLEPYNDKAQGDAVLWTLEMMPPLFANREYAIKTRAAQDPKTKVVHIDIMAAPSKLAPNDCCLRITHIHNRWQISPAKDGQVEIQLVQDFSMGGFFPDLLVNISGVEETYKLFHESLPGLVNKEKYLKARFDYIDEKPSGTAL